MVMNRVEGDVERLMRDGQAAAKRGDKVMARALLTQLLELDPHNEQAWMWLSGAVADPHEQLTCLENVLIINPNNVAARKGLEYISGKSGVTSRAATPADGPETFEAANGTEAAHYEQAAQSDAPQFGSDLADPAAFELAPFEFPGLDSTVNGTSGGHQPDPAKALPEVSPQQFAAQPEAALEADPAMTWKSRDELTSPLTDVPALASEFVLPAPGSGELPPWERGEDTQEPSQWGGFASADTSGDFPFGPEFNMNGSYGPSGGQPAAREDTWSASSTPSDESGAGVAQPAYGDDFTPFQLPQAADMPAFGGSTPTLGLSGDLDSELPEWMSGPSNQTRPDNGSAPQNGAAPEMRAPAAEVPSNFGPVPMGSMPLGGESSFSGEPNGGREHSQNGAYNFGGEPAAPQVQQSAEDAGLSSDLTSWLGKVSPAPDAGGYAAFDPAVASMPPADAQAQVMDADPFAHNGHAQSDPFAAQAHGDPFAGPGGFEMGPFTANNLPSPEELPGGAGAENPAQPWYLQSSNEPARTTPDYLSSSHYDDGGSNFGQESQAVAAAPREVATVACPHCKQQVPETALACPECSFSFFVHCPHCHELVDTSDAKAGVTGPCPYCSSPITKMDMGLVNVQGAMLVPRPEGKNKGGDLSFAGAGQEERSGLAGALGVVVDLMWLFAIILMVWALTQFPAWFNLTNLYG